LSFKRKVTEATKRKGGGGQGCNYRRGTWEKRDESKKGIRHLRRGCPRKQGGLIFRQERWGGVVGLVRRGM